MDFELSDRTRQVQEQLQRFMDEHVYPHERTYAEQLEAFRRARDDQRRRIEDEFLGHR